MGKLRPLEKTSLQWVLEFCLGWQACRDSKAANLHSTVVRAREPRHPRWDALSHPLFECPGPCQLA